jgi:hypothetical protein
MPDANASPAASSTDRTAVRAAEPARVPLSWVGVGALFVLAGVLWLFVALRSREGQLARTEQALVLQSLAAHTGAASVLAERGRFTEARELMTVVFDDIQQRGLAGPSSLPANQAAVLTVRDTVMLSLDRGQARIAALLQEQFFRLQAPAGTALDASALIAALSSGAGRALPPALSAEGEAER